MEKSALEKDLLKISGEPFLSKDEVAAWLGDPSDKVLKLIFKGLKEADLGKTKGYLHTDIARAVMDNVRNNRKMKPEKVGRGERGVQKKDLVADLKETFGASFVTAGEISQWLGRSSSFVSDHIINDLPSMRKLYFVGDVADKMMELRRSW